MIDGNFKTVEAGSFNVETNEFTASPEIHWFGKSYILLNLTLYILFTQKTGNWSFWVTDNLPLPQFCLKWKVSVIFYYFFFWICDLECSALQNASYKLVPRVLSWNPGNEAVCLTLVWTANVAYELRFSSENTMDLKLFNLKCLLKFQLALPTPRPQRTTFTVQLTGPCFSCWSGLLPLGSRTLCSAS